jgi:tetratricopeptide (TPR) repeat protein
LADNLPPQIYKKHGVGKMKISRVGILLLITITILSVSGCSIVNRVFARNELNDGAKAYKERKFAEAEKHFRKARDLDPDQMIAQRLLARSLHQQFLSNRTAASNLAKGEEATEIYKKILEQNPNDEETNRAVANLLEITKGQPAQTEWMQKRANDERVAPENRADAFTSLASKQYNCANEITELTKQNVVKDNKAIYVFKKPENPEEFDKARQCTQTGTELIDKAISLDPNDDSAWSYKASLLVQQARIAEMENNPTLKEQLMKQSDEAKAKFLALSEEKARKREEEEARKKAEAEEKK